MKIIQFSQNLISGVTEVLSSNQITKVYKLNDGSILKLFNYQFIESLKQDNVQIEKKILAAKPIKKVPEIIVPEKAVYSQQSFIGYKMPYANGINYNQYDLNLTLDERCDLQKYALVHKKIEDILKKANNIVFPDLLSCDNIFIDSNFNIQLIDYDGIQVDDFKIFSMSTSLGSEACHFIPKYWNEKKQLFTKELDKKNSVYFYFLTAFNTDLNKVGTINPFNGNILTLEELFNSLGLDDNDFCHKVWKLFQDNLENEYLDNDTFRIAEKYNMTACEIPSIPGAYKKKLTKK